MNKFNLSKQKILILAISAVVVIGGAVAAVAIFRNADKAKEDTTTSATVQQYDYVEETYYEDVPVLVTDENKSTVTDPSGNALTTLKRVVHTTRKAANKTPTKKPAVTAANNNATTKKPEGNTGLVPDAIGDGGSQFAGYRYNSAGNFYYTDDKDCWQKNAGYNEVYDNMAPMAGMFIDQIRIRFSYEGKDWMLQFWKGQYGFLLVGAEIGVYTAPLGTYKNEKGAINHYDCADKEDWLNMQLDCYWSENNNGHYKKIFTREYGKYWWATGFVKGQLTKYTIPKTELKLKGRITFKSTEMANLFVYGLKESGFVRAIGSDQLVDDSYYQSGADVWLLWSTIYHDCFVDENGDSVPAATTTKKPVTTTKKAETTKKVTTTVKPTEPTTVKPTEPTTAKPTEPATEATTAVVTEQPNGANTED